MRDALQLWRNESKLDISYISSFFFQPDWTLTSVQGLGPFQVMTLVFLAYWPYHPAQESFKKGQLDLVQMHAWLSDGSDLVDLGTPENLGFGFLIWSLRYSVGKLMNFSHFEL